MQGPLIPFVASYIYGIVAAELFRYFPITVSLVFLLLFVSMFYFRKVIPFTQSLSHWGRGISLPLIVIVGVITGFFYMFHDRRVPHDDVSHYATGEKETVIGMVDEPPRFSSKRVVSHIRAFKILKGGEELKVSGRVRLTVYDPEMILSYGDIIRFTGRLKIIRGFRNPGLFDYARYIARERIRASVGIGKKEHIVKIGTGGRWLLRRIYEWREEIRLSISRGLSDTSSAILQAMVIGATGDLTPAIRDKFTAAGITHILSISGSHLGFVSFLVFFFIRYSVIYLPCGMLIKISRYIIPSKIAAFGTFPTIIFYTLLSGGEVATVRSLIMAMVYLTAILIEREDDALNTLVVAALMVLLWEPQALFDISFQLSYMAVLSMILAMKRFYKRVDEDRSLWWRKYYKRFKLLLLLTTGAMLSTTPIVAHYYNQITWVGLISNMVIVPYVGFATLPVGLFTSCLTLIWGRDVILFSWLNELLLHLLYGMVEIFAGFPLSVIHTSSIGIPLILSLYPLFFSFLYLKESWAKISLSLSLSLLILAMSSDFLIDKREMLRVTFLDVGQGDSALIEFPDGKVMLIDGGGTFSDTFDTGRSILAPYLWNRGIRKVDYVVSTHPQLDHVKGLTYIAEKFTIGEVWTNGRKGSAASDFYRVVESKGVKNVIIHRDMEKRMIGSCIVNFLNPLVDLEKMRWKENDLSIVVKLNCRGISFLFTGDIESGAMHEIVEKGMPIESSVIKVPHHGARGSVEEGFISAVKPGIAVISAGYQNSYHHPSPEAISAYERAGAAIYRTDQDGAVIIEAKGRKLRVRRYEDMVLREVNFENLRSLFMTEMSNLEKVMGVKPPKIMEG